MSKSFEDLLSKVSECSVKKVAVAVAQDSAVLEAVEEHCRGGFGRRRG